MTDNSLQGQGSGKSQRKNAKQFMKTFWRDLMKKSGNFLPAPFFCISGVLITVDLGFGRLHF